MPSNVRREVITRDYYPDSGQNLKSVAMQGKNGDTQLAHVNPIEAELLKRLGGSGTTNPNTGLKQFYDTHLVQGRHWGLAPCPSVVNLRHSDLPMKMDAYYNAPAGWNADQYLINNPDVAGRSLVQKQPSGALQYFR